MLHFSIITSLLSAVACEVCPRPEVQDNKYSATSNQLLTFKSSVKGPIGDLTTSAGRLLDKDTANEVINDNLIFNDRFVVGLLSLVREPTLPRIVHAKGGGAIGYFEVTHDVKDITNIGMFNGIGKKTPLVARFSTSSKDFGSSDTVRDIRGFSIKFKTPEGNLDLLGLSTPVFSIKDPVKFPTFIHATRRNPQTFTTDENMLWDFITLNPESISFILRLLSDIGVPYSYANIPSYPIHTFVFCNSKGKRIFGRFRLKPDDGVKGLANEDAVLIAGEDPDYLNRDLYDRIERGEYPSWTLYIQALSEEEAKKAKIDIWDITLDLDESIYVPRPIGKVYLNENPQNFIRDVESLGFSVRNLVPGIQGVDKLFEARSLVYHDALNLRLGVNHNKIPINRPLAETYTYYRDGAQPLDSNGNNAPNYYPNSFFGPVPVTTLQCAKFSKLIVTNPKPTNFDQAAEFFNGLDKNEQNRLIQNIALSLFRITATFLRIRAIELFNRVDSKLGSSIEAVLESMKSELEKSQQQENKLIKGEMKDEKEIKLSKNKSEANDKEKQEGKGKKEIKGVVGSYFRPIKWLEEKKTAIVKKGLARFLPAEEQ